MPKNMKVRLIIKTLNKIVVFVLLAALSSCVSNNVSVVKRRYNSGYYVNIHSPKKDKTVVIQKNKLLDTKVENSIVHQTVVPSNIESKTELVQVGESCSESPKIKSITNKKLYASSNKLEVKEAKEILKSVQFSQQKNRLKHNSTIVKNKKINTLQAQKKSSDDLPTVALVVLALFPFISLIAMVLHDGDITLNFWVNLLLHLTVIGYAIFGVLVVLDIIDLS
jgi:hypothetical protein